MRNPTREFTKDFASEEFANRLTHVGGLLLAVVGATIFFNAVAEHPNDALRLGCYWRSSNWPVIYALSCGLVG